MSAPEDIPVPSVPDLRVWARELCDQLAPMPPEAISKLVALYDTPTPTLRAEAA